MKSNVETHVCKIDKRVANTEKFISECEHRERKRKEKKKNLLAIVCEINSQVHKVVLAPARLVDDRL